MKINKFTALFIIVGATMILNVKGLTAQNNSSHQMKHDNGHGAHPKLHATKLLIANSAPTQPGQDAFGAIQEIINMLEADPDTDWSKVDISKLRSHLVDMNRMVMGTQVARKNIEGGLELIVTGSAQTLQSIHNMLPAHAPMINGLNDWSARVKVTANGAILTVTAKSDKEILHIRGLGFYGLLASGSHHQAHHISLARGVNVHLKQ
jgi:hypothetical protein